MSSRLKGIAASQGIAIAKAFRIDSPDLAVEKKSIDDVEEEIHRLEQALLTAKRELERIKARAFQELDADKAEIFSAHLLVLNDPEWINPAKEMIQADKCNAEFALDEIANNFIAKFEQMDSEYLKERAADIYDVKSRVLSHLLDVKRATLSTIAEEVIVIAEDLSPSDTIQINKKYVKGFVTAVGGGMSHSVIMARSMELPAVVGAKSVMNNIRNGELVIVDGVDGEIILNPSNDQIAQYESKQAKFHKKKSEWVKLVDEPTVTSDGSRIRLAANITAEGDIDGVLHNGAEGIGLYRTEFLYIGRDRLPTEEEQFERYKLILQEMDNKPVIMRTLDIGGDKELPYLNLVKELNPFLGLRAIRFSLQREDIFRAQLRALLRASAFGDLKIMFPMISVLQELRTAKQILLEEKERLQEQQIAVAQDIEVGMMIETPAAAITAEQFAKDVDFFSIGTNDLIQYTLAADRMNEQVAYLYQPFHPAILRLIKNITNAAHKEGKWVGMCGEMAGDPIALPLLLGLGVDELSMSVSSILPIRSQLLHLSKEDATIAAEHALSKSTAEEVARYIQDKFNI